MVNSNSSDNTTGLPTNIVPRRGWLLAYIVKGEAGNAEGKGKVVEVKGELGNETFSLDIGAGKIEKFDRSQLRTIPGMGRADSSRSFPVFAEDTSSGRRVIFSYQEGHSLALLVEQSIARASAAGVDLTDLVLAPLSAGRNGRGGLGMTRVYRLGSSADIAADIAAHGNSAEKAETPPDADQPRLQGETWVTVKDHAGKPTLKLHVFKREDHRTLCIRAFSPDCGVDLGLKRTTGNLYTDKGFLKAGWSIVNNERYQIPVVQDVPVEAAASETEQEAPAAPAPAPAKSSSKRRS